MKDPKAPKYNLDASAHRPQYFATFCASLGALAAGSIIGYASPASVQLRGFNPVVNNSEIVHPPVVLTPKSTPFHDHDLDHYIYNTTEMLRFNFPNHSFVTEQSGPPDTLTLSTYELSWFFSSLYIGALLGSVLVRPMLNFMGRRGGMIASTVPCLLGWLLLGFGSNVAMLVAGRILQGVFVGITCLSVNTFVGEIASSDIRGRLGISSQLMVSFGVVYTYTFGSLTSWYNLAFICCAPAVFFAVFMVFFVNESPLHLLAKGKKGEAAAALQFFRGKQYDVTKELEELDSSRREALENKLSWSELKQSYIQRPVLLVMALMLFQQISGFNAMIFNLETILQKTSHLLPPEWSTVLSGVTLITSDLLSVLLIDSMGRKSLLITSATVMALTQGCIGLFFFYLERLDEAFAVQYLSWLPVVAVMVFLVAFSVGFGAVPWVVMGELLPPSIREAAGVLGFCTSWIMSFAVTFSFEPLQVLLHSYGYYWMLAGFNALAAVFSVLFIFETKGKTLQEISLMFGSK